MSLKRASGSAVANFIRGNIICRIGIPKHLLSNSGTQFINVHLLELFNAYRIDHVNLTPLYLQRNGQAEATDKKLL